MKAISMIAVVVAVFFTCNFAYGQQSTPTSTNFQIVTQNDDGEMDFANSINWRTAETGIFDAEGYPVLKYSESGIRSFKDFQDKLRNDPSTTKVEFMADANLLLVSAKGITGEVLKAAIVSRIPKASLEFSGAEGTRKADVVADPNSKGNGGVKIAPQGSR